jgi:SnoaL-like domain
VKNLASVLSLGVLLSVASLAQAGELSTQDYIEIQQLYATYNNAIDTGDAEGWAATFTPDGTFNTFKGKDALVGFVQQWKDKMGGLNRRHWNANLSIQPTNDGATGKTLLMLLDVASKAIVTTGSYADELVKTPQGWRFKNRQFTRDAAPTPAAPTLKP